MRDIRAFLIAGFLTAGCGGSAATPPPVTPPVTAPAEANAGPTEGEHHRGRHHGGVGMLIAMSLKDLDLTPDQRTAVEKTRADLLAKMEPTRADGKDLANTLADGVAAGAVDRAKADAAIEKLAGDMTAVQAASGDAMKQLHDQLTSAQRAALIDKMQGHFEKWKEAHGRDEQDDHAQHPGQLAAFSKDLGLTQDQQDKIRASFKEGIKSNANGQGHEHKEVQDHMAAFGTAFKADTFDPKAMGPGANAANGHMARWGATRMARFLEAAAPVLTPEQRAKLAQKIRDGGNRKDQ